MDVREIVHTAARRIQAVRAESIETDLKKDKSPVTRADHESDALLRTRLTSLLPVGWLSEETADRPDRLRERLLWVVDPLDGTKEFIKNIPEYSIAVALVEDGEPILGMVHNPATEESFWGVKGLGAFRDSGKPIAVHEGSVILASRSELKRGEFEPFVREQGAGRRGEDVVTSPSSLLPPWEVVGRGSIQLKLAHVAAGLGSVTFSRGPKHEWDVCAGALLVAEAGGKVTDLFGDSLVFNQAFPKTRGILAGAPVAYTAVLERIRDIGASDRMEEEWERR